MKKCTLTLALVLCLVLCAFAFASCGKDKAASTTAAKATAGTTECAHVWGEYVYDVEPTCSDPGMKSRYCTICGAQDPASVAEVETIAHTEAENYTVDTPATCSAVGYESKHCTVCGQPIASTVRTIEIDENGHDVEEWTVTSAATLLNPTGSRTGTCKLCHNPVVEVLTFQPIVNEISSTASNNYVVSSSYKDEILAGGKHFYPDESNSNAGADLFIEFSILWNPTLVDNCEGVMKTGNCGTNFKSNNVSTTWMSICDNYSDSWCPYAGGFEACDIGNVEFGYPNMGTQNAAYAEYPNIGGADQNNPEYGWHRVTIQLHQELTNEAALKADGTAGATQALYKLTGTYYFDGVKVAALSYSGDGKTNGGYWQASGKTKMGKGLFTAQSDGEGGITYTDCYDNDAPLAFIAVVGKAKAENAPGYFVLGDVSFTCGDAPVQDVQRVTDPTDATYTVAEGVVVPAKVYYKFAD